MRPTWFAGAAGLTLFCALSHAACPEPVNMQLQLNESLICITMDDAALKKQLPLLRAWIQDPIVPSVRQLQRPGRWVSAARAGP